MTIGIDIRVLGKASRSGVEEYTENLLSHMIPLGEEMGINFRLFYSSFNNKLNNYDWLHYPNVELIEKKIPNRILFTTNRWLNVPKIDGILGGVDIFFSPHFFLASLSPNCKRVVTFHDLSFEHFPEFFSLRKRIWHRLEMKPRWQSKFSDKIIAVSESTKNDLVNLYGIDPAKIKTIHSGISPIFNQMTDEEELSFRNENDLPDKYILFLGKLEPRKNIASIIRAFDILNHSQDFKEYYLVIVGNRGWLDKDIGERHIASPNRNRIIFRNQIDNESRVGYYNCAELLVYPSFFEGFGFPPLEAMTCGVPVITSFNSSLPEIVGDSSILIDPANVSELAGAIGSIIKDSKLKKTLINKGLKRIEAFSWKKTAKQTLDLIVK